MPLLDYANLTVPDLVKTYSFTGATKNHLIARLVKERQVRRSKGPYVVLRRIKGRHSDAQQVTAANLQVRLSKVDTFGTMQADWPHMVQPIILPHPDRWRLGDTDEIKRWVDACVRAATSSHNLAVTRRLYSGTTVNADYTCIASLNGSDVSGTTLGLTNGALRFQTPTAQAAAAVSYLGVARVQDTTYGINNWYNQYAQHAGIGVNAMAACARVKAAADEHDAVEEEFSGGISIGILETNDWVALGDEIRTYPGAGTTALHYTVADLEAGKAYPAILMAHGITFYPSRWMSVAGVTEPIYLLNPKAVEVWVHAGQDGKVGKFVDFMQTVGYDADVAFVRYSVQPVLTNPTACGCVSA